MAHNTNHCDPVQRLAREYAEARRRSRTAAAFMRQPRDGALQVETFRYLPEHHFRQAYDRLVQPEDAGESAERGEGNCTCQQCSGSVHRVRTDQRAYLEVEYYRCQAEDGCRQGGERVYDRTGELMRTVGPVFDEDQNYSLTRLLDRADTERPPDALRQDLDLEPDGGYDTLHAGTRRATVYYWLDPETGAALYHTGVNDEATIPFFADESAARDYLENRAETGDTEQYDRVSLYKARTRKVADAVDVLTQQAGFDEFVPE